MRTAAAIVASSLAVLAAACSGSPSSGHANGALAFAGCMRSHRVPNWPDPDSSGAFDKSKLTLQQLGATGAQVEMAQRACSHLLPNGGNEPNAAQVQQGKAIGLSFARCVRAHGVPRFPDPDSTGRIPDPATVGIDQGSPKFEAANRACATYRPPYIPSSATYNAWARAHPSG